MNRDLQRYFEQERRRVMEPSDGFERRVMAAVRVDSAVLERESGFWDLLPTSAKPVVALAFVFLLVMGSLVVTVPALTDNTSAVDALLEEDQQPAERWIYSEDATPDDSEFLSQILNVELAQ